MPRVARSRNPMRHNRDMNIRPLRNNVVVERLKSEDTTPGGIIIPDNAKERPARGKVIAVGPGSVNHHGTFIETTVKVGQEVLFGKYAGTEIQKLADTLIISEDDILAVVEK